MKTDRFVNKYHNLSSYAFTANNPILFIDKDGNDFIIFYAKTVETKTIIDKQDFIGTKTHVEYSYAVIPAPGPDRFFYSTSNDYVTIKKQNGAAVSISTNNVPGWEIELQAYRDIGGYKSVNDRYATYGGDGEPITTSGYWPFEYANADAITIALLAPNDLKKHIGKNDPALERVLNAYKTEYFITQVGLAIESFIDLSPAIYNALRNAVFTSTNIAAVEKHLLTNFGSCAENEVMLQRMSAIKNGELKATQVDINFMNHELREAELLKQGMSKDAAHNAVLEEQGMSGGVNYHEMLYTKEALKAGDAAEAAKHGIKH